MNRPSAARARVRSEPIKHKRTRSGCLNCRRKKRKCDESRPVCGTCRRRNESCEWGLKIAFRAEHAQCLNARHPSMRKMARRRQPREFEILDVTDEVIRDYNGAETEEEDNATSDDRARTSTSGRSNLIVGGRRHASNNTPSGYASIQQPPVVDISSPTSQRQTENAVADLLYFSQNGQSHSSVDIDPALQVSMQAVPIDMIADYPYIDQMQAFTPEGISEDGIFLPGSAYHELHSTLRNHLIQETRSIAPTRSTTPHVEVQSSGGVSLEETEITIPIQEFQPSQTPLLSQQEECSLWKNYFDEIAPWLDKFDRDRHFQQIIPTMSKDNDHLRYSMLALSARQLELKHTLPTNRSLALYQEAIHMLLPHLPTRGTAVIATCVILCVLEMLSCSPKAWQRHLDGCASLMEAVGINGFVGGTEQALFWCFARMDICGGLISSVKTLIPICHWASKTLSIDNDVELFKNAPTFEDWANYAVYLTAQVLDLLAASPTDPTRDEARFQARWLKLWKYISEWYQERPAPLHPIMTIPSSESSPFPTILYSNPAAMSGNQMHHAASILMLQNQPSTVRLGHASKSRSILWHARQVCGISMSNEHHGAWTNSVQPLWIAGRCMSHPSEHKAILEMLDRIERESGWSTKWRVDDLKEFYKCSLSTV